MGGIIHTTSLVIFIAKTMSFSIMYKYTAFEIGRGGKKRFSELWELGRIYMFFAISTEFLKDCFLLPSMPFLTLTQATMITEEIWVEGKKWLWLMILKFEFNILLDSWLYLSWNHKTPPQSPSSKYYICDSQGNNFDIIFIITHKVLETRP